MTDVPIQDARTALAHTDGVIDRLHKMCCEPDRSPRMLALKASIASATKDIDAGPSDPAALDRAIATLVDVGGELGKLQVECCAPARMPLYADALEHLTDVQLNINKSVGRGH
jgi:hypothetical protein